jgi:hypothetical protein
VTEVGLITGLLTLPLAPVRGVAWVAELVAEQAEQEYEARHGLRARLLELEMAHDRGEIDADELARLEALLLAGEGGNDGRP